MALEIMSGYKQMMSVREQFCTSSLKYCNVFALNNNQLCVGGCVRACVCACVRVCVHVA